MSRPSFGKPRKDRKINCAYYKCKRRFLRKDSWPYGDCCSMKCFYAVGVENAGGPQDAQEQRELSKLKREMGVDD